MKSLWVVPLFILIIVSIVHSNGSSKEDGTVEEEGEEDLMSMMKNLQGLMGDQGGNLEAIMEQIMKLERGEGLNDADDEDGEESDKNIDSEKQKAKADESVKFKAVVEDEKKEDEEATTPPNPMLSLFQSFMAGGQMGKERLGGLESMLPMLAGMMGVQFETVAQFLPIIQGLMADKESLKKLQPLMETFHNLINNHLGEEGLAEIIQATMTGEMTEDGIKSLKGSFQKFIADPKTAETLKPFVEDAFKNAMAQGKTVMDKFMEQGNDKNLWEILQSSMGNSKMADKLKTLMGDKVEKLGEGWKLGEEMVKNFIGEKSAFDLIPSVFREYVPESLKKDLLNIKDADLAKLKEVYNKVETLESLDSALKKLKEKAPKVHKILKGIYTSTKEKLTEVWNHLDKTPKKLTTLIYSDFLTFLDSSFKRLVDSLEIDRSNLKDSVVKAFPLLELPLEKMAKSKWLNAAWVDVQYAKPGEERMDERDEL